MSRRNSVITSDLVVDHETAAGTVRALTQHSMFVEGGTSVAIMGPSGCGKSTLLGLLAGLAVPTQGTVTIGGRTISELRERARIRFRREEVGMVYQADNLLPYLTVEENVALPLAITGHAGAEDVAALLGRLGLGGLAARFPDHLSGGQRQRVAVARAVVHRPMLILADEPTGALDADNARGVIELLIDVQREMGATLILVTHDPAAATHAERVELLNGASSTYEPLHAG